MKISLSSVAIAGIFFSDVTAFAPNSNGATYSSRHQSTPTNSRVYLVDKDSGAFVEADEKQNLKGNMTPRGLGVSKADGDKISDVILADDTILRESVYVPGRKISRHSHPGSLFHTVTEGCVKVTTNGVTKLFIKGDWFIIEKDEDYEMEVPDVAEGNNQGVSILMHDYSTCTRK
mmetsp:Transcript_31190/g.35890  ORF Transcript_31190/g.35890 Transcript_31190/m.35890 type:complete len:175 (-) Transcript_31190:126-650(-)